MAISNFEVGSIFTIEDRATGMLTGMAEQMERLDGLAKSVQESFGLFAETSGQIRIVTESMDGLEGSILSISDSMTTLTDVAFAGFRDMTSQVSLLVGEMRGLAEATREAAAANAALMGEGVTGGAVGGGGRGHRGGVASGLAKGAGYGGMLSHPGALIGGYVAYKSMQAGAEEDMALAQALLSMRQPITPENIDIMKSLAYGARKGTIFSEAQSASAMPALGGLLAPFGFSGNDAMKKFGDIFPTITQAAEVASMRIEGADFLQNERAFGMYSHLTGRYQGQGVINATNQLLNISEAAHTTPQQEVTMLQRVLPMARAAHMDLDDVAAAAGGMQTLGLGNKAGYALSNILVGLTKSGGSLQSHVDTVSGDLERSLGFKHGALKGAGGNVHTKDLKTLGIMDEKGNLLVLDDKKRISFERVFEKVEEYGRTHDPNEALGLLFGAFNQRGLLATGLAADPDAMSKFQSYREYIKNAPTASEQQGVLAKQDLQIYERTWAEAKTAFTMLGGTLEHVFAPAALHLADMLGSLTGFLNGLRDPDSPSIVTKKGFGMAYHEFLAQGSDAHANIINDNAKDRQLGNSLGGGSSVAATTMSSSGSGDTFHINGPVYINAPNAMDGHAILKSLSGVANSLSYNQGASGSIHSSAFLSGVSP